MQYNYRGNYDASQSYVLGDVVSYAISGTTRYYYCLTANSNASPQYPTNTDTNYWGIINALSNFPNSIDSFMNHQIIQASDKDNLSRFQTLSLQSSLTSSEQDELATLTQTLRNKLILPDDFNALQASISNMQMFLQNSVVGYINQKQDEFNAKISQFTDKGMYSSSTTYQATNFVTYGNESYICLNDNTVGVPPTDTTAWRKVAAQGAKGDTGLSANYKGEYNSTTSYGLGDAVSYQGIFYYAKTTVTGDAPTDSTNWQILNNLFIGGTAPSAPAVNQAWLDTGSNKIKFWNSTIWVENNASNADQLGNQLPSYYATAQNLTNHLSDYAHQYSADTGSANAYVVTLNPAPNAYVTGMMVYFLATFSNSGASTINVNGLGAKTIKKNISLDLVTGDIKAGQIILVVYDGTNFQIASSASSFNPLTNPSFWIN